MTKVTIKTRFGTLELKMPVERALDLMSSAAELAAELEEDRAVPKEEPAPAGEMDRPEEGREEGGSEEAKAEPIKPSPCRNSRVENLFGSRAGWYAPAATLAEDERPETAAAPPLSEGENGKGPEPEKAGEKPGWYKGFLRVKCEDCGQVDAFCAKKATSSHICRGCGHRTALWAMRKLNFTCKCRKTFAYQTNERDSRVTVECLDCGRSNELLWRANKGSYVSAKGVVW